VVEESALVADGELGGEGGKSASSGTVGLSNSIFLFLIQPQALIFLKRL